MALSKKPAQDEGTMMGGKKVRTVRGGGICSSGDKPALTRDTLKTVTCQATPGADPRPRWRVAGSNISSTGSQGSHGTRGSRGKTHGSPTAEKEKPRLLRQRSG
jgi:hypothetical protein